MSDCNCYLDEMITKKCVICEYDGLARVNLWDRYGACELHKKQAFTICGFGEFVCGTCVDQGWYSTAGRGGGTYHFNEKTMQRKLKSGEIVSVDRVF
jgi:hypothetical protein